LHFSAQRGAAHNGHQTSLACLLHGCYQMNMPIGSISDTARLTAYARALEAERSDALFRDPYARRLAGSEGFTLASQSGLAARIAAGVATRTAVFDEWVMRKVRQEGADLVVNLAAGLDTRPWRLDLPSRLRWVDVDLPDILQYKTDLLRAQSPRCVYEVRYADPADPKAVDQLLEHCGGAKRALILTESLLVYLQPEQVSALARTLYRQAWIAWWITDLASPRTLAAMERMWGSVRSGARFQFAPADRAKFFRPLGWRQAEFRSSQAEARRLGRAPTPSLLGGFALRLASASFRDETRRLPGYAVLARTEAAQPTVGATSKHRQMGDQHAWHAVSIATRKNSCTTAKALHGKRFLSAAAPSLPLGECALNSCPCAYKHFADRRAEPRREEEVIGRRRIGHVAPERRVKRGRRKTDN
jgi:methyltransferase (TIGR00027 family)